MELYLVFSIVDRFNADKMTGIMRSCGANMILTNLARGTATSEQLLISALERKEKALVSGVMCKKEKDSVFIEAKRTLYIDIPGNGVMMSVPIKSVYGASTLDMLTEGQNKTEGSPEMKFDHELIVVILNEGYSDTVMDAARSAGAGGGTVIHAKGTGKNRKGVKFLSLSLAEEKDMVFILADTAKKSAIMEAINLGAGKHTKAGAISFSLPVSETAGLRVFTEDNK